MTYKDLNTVQKFLKDLENNQIKSLRMKNTVEIKYGIERLRNREVMAKEGIGERKNICKNYPEGNTERKGNGNRKHCVIECACFQSLQKGEN